MNIQRQTWFHRDVVLFCLVGCDVKEGPSTSKSSKCPLLKSTTKHKKDGYVRQHYWRYSTLQYKLGDGQIKKVFRSFFYYSLFCSVKRNLICRVSFILRLQKENFIGFLFSYFFSHVFSFLPLFSRKGWLEGFYAALAILGHDMQKLVPVLPAKNIQRESVLSFQTAEEMDLKNEIRRVLIMEMKY